MLKSVPGTAKNKFLPIKSGRTLKPAGSHLNLELRNMGGEPRSTELELLWGHVTLMPLLLPGEQGHLPFL